MDLWQITKNGYLRLVAPLADWMVARRVNPNTITTLGTVCAMIAAGFYAAGQIRVAGLVLGVTAVFDVIDGEVARRSGRSTAFGAFYDSTLDRISDGALLGGLAIFFARTGVHQSIPAYMSTPMVTVVLLGIIGSFLTSYTRARAEGLGIDARVGILQRPERITLLSGPQAVFGLMLGGWVLIGICVLLSVTAWITVVQRIAFVHRATVLGSTSASAPRARSQPADVRVASDGRPQSDSGRRPVPGDVAPSPRLDVVR